MIQKDTYTPMFIGAIVTLPRHGNTLMSISIRVDKDDVVYIHNGMLLNHRKEIMPFLATWIQLEIIILSEASQKEICEI